MDGQKEPSISDLLLSAGLRHARDAYSHIDSRHSIWRGETLIGRYSAAQAVELLKELEAEKEPKAEKAA